MSNTALFSAAILVLLLPAAALGQSEPPDLRRAVEAREAALAAGDSETWARFTTDDFMRVETDGAVTTKAEQMARLKARPMQPQIRNEQKWRMHKTTAIET